MYPNIAETVWKFIGEDDKNFNKLRNILCQFYKIFQYVSTLVYPKIYCKTERRGFDLKSTFQLILKTYKDKKRLEQLGKDLCVFLKDRNKQFKFKQKPIEIDDFNDQEEQEVRKKLKEEKKRHEITEKK